MLTSGQRRLPALSVLTDIGLWGRFEGLEATARWKHTPPRKQPKQGTNASLQAVCGNGARSGVHMQPPTHANTPDTPSKTLQLNSSPSALHHQPSRAIYLPAHTSIHPAIDFDKLTSDPISPLPHDSPAPLLNLQHPPHTYAINIHPPYIHRRQACLTRLLMWDMCRICVCSLWFGRAAFPSDQRNSASFKNPSSVAL